MVRYASDNYYSEEKKIYKEAYGFELEDGEVKLILKKLCRHYRVSVPSVRFWGAKQSGSAGSYRLTLSHNPSVGLLIHEFGHYVKDKSKMRDILKKVSNRGTEHHGLKFQTALSRTHAWANEKGYWKEQLMRRREKAQQKIHEKNREKTADEVLAGKIYKIEQDIKKKQEAIKRYQKKLQYYQKLYTTKTKKANRSIGALKRHIVKFKKNA